MAKLVLIINFAATVWVLYQIWGRNRRFSDTEKLIWTVSAVFLGLLTAIVYLLVQRGKRNY